MQTRNALTLLVGVVVLTFVPASTSHAAKSSQKFNTSFSGTIVNIPLDFDADSCTTSGGVTVCTDFSSYFTSSAKGTGAVGGDSTGQAVEEYDPVSGSGCNIFGSPAPIAGCTLTGSMLFETESTTVCEDLSSGPPFNSTAAANGTITGGTGKFSGATGTFTSVAHGQVLLSDPTGHGFGWFEGSSTGTITTP